VQPHSTTFHEIIHTIHARADLLTSIFDRLPVDDADRTELQRDLAQIKSSFSGNIYRMKWQQLCDGHLKAEYVRGVAAVSPLVKTVCQYPKLSNDEVNDLLSSVDQLLEWLRGYQLEDQDFIRQIIIDGLEAFRVRLKHLGWLGWGYTVQSLQEVLTAYMVIERQQPFASPSMEARYKKTTAFLKKTAQTITSAKAVVEATRFSLEFYAVLAATQHGAPAAAKAALTFFGAGS